MDQEFTPQQSFELINSIIDKRKRTYEENGHTIFLWGLGVVVAGVGHHLLIMNGVKTSHAIWAATMIPLFIYTFYYYYTKIKKSGKKGMYGQDIGAAVWSMSGTMAMLSGFVFSAKLGSLMLTVMWLPFCVAAMGTAVYLQKRIFAYMSVIASFLAYGAMFVPYMYHPLVTAGIAAMLFLIPGYILKRDYKNRVHV